MTRVFPCSAQAEQTIRSIPLEVRRQPLGVLDRRIDRSTTPCNVAGANPELWFPDEGDRPQTSSAVLLDRARRDAHGLCQGCPVQLTCLERSLRQGPEQWGVSGGMSKADREAGYGLWVSLDPELVDDDLEDPAGAGAATPQHVEGADDAAA